MGDSILQAMAVSLGLTLILETGFCLAVGVRGARNILLILLVNILTNPAVVVMHSLLTLKAGFPEPAVVIPLELGAVLAEGLCYKYCSDNIRRPFLLSLGANLFSYLSGLLLSIII